MTPSAPLTQSDLIANELLANRGLWISMPHLADISGSFNIHSRIDELRHLRGLTIENRITRFPGTRTNHSHYRIPLQHPTPTISH